MEARGVESREQTRINLRNTCYVFLQELLMPTVHIVLPPPKTKKTSTTIKEDDFLNGVRWRRKEDDS